MFLLLLLTAIIAGFAAYQFDCCSGTSVGWDDPIVTTREKVNTIYQISEILFKPHVIP